MLGGESPEEGGDSKYLKTDSGAKLLACELEQESTRAQWRRPRGAPRERLPGAHGAGRPGARLASISHPTDLAVSETLTH